MRHTQIQIQKPHPADYKTTLSDKNASALKYKNTLEYKKTPGPPSPVFFCIRMVLTKASLTTSISFENADRYKTTLIQYKNTPHKYKDTPLKYTRTPFCMQLTTEPIQYNTFAIPETHRYEYKKTHPTDYKTTLFNKNASELEYKKTL